MKRTILLKFVIVWCIFHTDVKSQQILFRVLDVEAGYLKDEYFVGEPVDFYYGIRNPSADPIFVPGKRNANESFKVSVSYITDEGSTRREFQFFSPVGGTGSTHVQLTPGSWYVYRIRVLYSQRLPMRKSPSGNKIKNNALFGLVFSKPGEYTAGFTPNFFDPRGLVPLHARPTWQVGMRFRIKYPPAGSPEEKVWRQIQDAETLVFIQTHGEVGTPETALKVAKILRNAPVSRYHNSLQAVLGAYYRRHWQKHNVGEHALIEIALQRKLPPDEIPADRKRLLDLLRRHAPELYRELNVKLAQEKKQLPASKLK